MMSVRNKTRGTLLASKLLTINSHFSNTLNHLNRNGIPGDCGLWITPCNSIYTVGMTAPVDIVFLDREGRVVKKYRNFPPNCFVDAVPGAISALELPSNRLHESGTDSGDILVLEPG